MKKKSEPEELIIGIDDAGRGPVIGPMILAGVLLTEETEKKLQNLGVKDSKLLSASQRSSLSAEIKKQVISYHSTLTTPTEIDNRAEMGTNLNNMEAVKSAEIINKLAKEHKNNKIKVILDCPSPNTKAWKNYLLKYIDYAENLCISCEHKADVNHPSVSAASILAKVARDAEIEKIKEKIGVDFGSGYPSDPVTIKFLKEGFKKYRKQGIFRETWGTVANFKKQKEQKKLLDFSS